MSSSYFLTATAVGRCAGPRQVLCYLIDSFGIERDVPLDLRNSRIRILIHPYGIDGLLSSSGNAVVTTLAFIRTVGTVIGPFQLRKIHVLTWNVLNGRIVGFAKCQRVAGIGDHATRDRYYDASWIPLDGNRMIWTRKLNLFFFHVRLLFCSEFIL